MSNITASTRSFSEIETLRAKWGWIVALGVIYSVAGLIALGSVLTATVASVFIVGIMMLIAGIAEVINAFQVKTWGKFLFWVLRTYCLRHYADHSGFLYEARNAMDLGGAVRCGHASAWPNHSQSLASIEPLHSRPAAGH